VRRDRFESRDGEEVTAGGGDGTQAQASGPKHRKRRERMAQEGWMVLWDGSPHPWFGPNHPPCCLMAAIDDATGKLLAASFLSL